jgi:hypothetical protein
MGAVVRSRRWSELAAVSLAPLTWIERTRGRKRHALLAVLSLLLAASGLLVWRAARLRGLPDLGEPFDVAAFGTIPVPDTENAFVLYRQAAARLKPLDPKIVAANPKIWDETDWAKSDLIVRRWAEENREAQDLWQQGTGCREAVLAQPQDMKMDTLLGPVQELRSLARLGLLEGSRREQAGDLEGAWELYRAVLRSSRHAGMHGGAVQRLIGLAIRRQATPHAARWAEHTRLTAPLLRRAIDDLGECAAMTPPISEMVRAEYFVARTALAEPDKWHQWGFEGPDDSTAWYNHFPFTEKARHFLRHEPERSRRVLDLIVAGHLVQCDRPRELRTRLVSPEFLIHAYDAAAPPAVRALIPRKLEIWLKSSPLAAFFPPLHKVEGQIDGERFALDLMRLQFAERCYGLDYGGPPKTYGVLVGPYLPSLPEGFEPSDAPTSPESGIPRPAKR